MNWVLLCRLLGLLGTLVGCSMTLSLPWAFPWFGHTPVFEARGFWGLLAAIGCSLLTGGAMYLVGRKDRSQILRKEALAVVGLGWIYAGILGSLPFLFSGCMRAPGVPMTVVDCLFESISGFTTTGASILTELEDHELVPRCVMFWRSFTHWLGGMGIIVLFVAILSHLGATGKALMRLEVPGPINEPLRPRVRESAIVMWVIYMIISGTLTIILLFEGMNWYDAFCHTFGTMATGGFSTYNKSVGHFQSPLIEGTLTLFMIAAGTNFSLYYLVFRNSPQTASQRWWTRFAPLYRDVEFRVYLALLLTATFVLAGNLLWTHVYPDLATAVRHASFVSVAIMTTTGFGTEDFTQWSEFGKGMLLMMMFIGGSAGSTGGGLKVIRCVLFLKIIKLEVEQSFRPKVVRPLRVAGVTVDQSLRHEVVVYFSIVLIIFISSWMLLSSIEPDRQWHVEDSKAEKLLDCASAVASSLNNIGPGLGVLGPHDNYSEFSQQGKLLLTLLMLLGRLELFAILVLFFPSFWRSQ